MNINLTIHELWLILSHNNTFWGSVSIVNYPWLIKRLSENPSILTEEYVFSDNHLFTRAGLELHQAQELAQTKFGVDVDFGVKNIHQELRELLALKGKTPEEIEQIVGML